MHVNVIKKSAFLSFPLFRHLVDSHAFPKTLMPKTSIS